MARLGRCKGVRGGARRSVGGGWALAFLGLLSCGGGANSGQYVAAAAGLGTAVALTAAYRSSTGECWAACEPGLLCDRSSGLCVRGECAPGCPVGRHCVRELSGEDHCVDDALSTSYGQGPATAPTPPGGPAAGATGQ